LREGEVREELEALERDGEGVEEVGVLRAKARPTRRGSANLLEEGRRH